MANEQKYLKLFKNMSCSVVTHNWNIESSAGMDHRRNVIVVAKGSIIHIVSKCSAKRTCLKCGYFGQYAEESLCRNKATDHSSAIDGGIHTLTAPVSSEISDFTPCSNAQSNILHIKYAGKSDYYGLEFSV